MPRKCSVCKHENVDEINKQLLEGVPLRDIAGHFGVSRAALTRHKAHIPEKLLKAHEIEEQASAENLLGELLKLKSKAEGILDAAENKGDLKTALTALKEVRDTLRLLFEVADYKKLDERITALEEQQEKGG